MADPLVDKINEAYDTQDEQVHREMDLAELEADLELGTLDFDSPDLSDYEGV